MQDDTQHPIRETSCTDGAAQNARSSPLAATFPPTSSTSTQSSGGNFCALDSNLGALFAFVSIVLIVPRITVAHISVIMAAQEGDGKADLRI